MDVSRTCSELVKIRSENPPGDTADIIEYIRNLLDGMGVRSEVFFREPGKCNLVTTGTGTDLLFCGHVDVVPACSEGWTYPPESGKIDEEYVWGRGSTDMKGGCAALLAACEEMVNRDISLPAGFAFVCDEEVGGDFGVRYLLSRNLLNPCDCLIAEPSPARHPSIGQKGLCRLVMKFAGTPAHGSLYPTVGVSAIMEAMALLLSMQDLHDHEYPVDDRLAEIIDASSAVLENEFAFPGVSEILRKIAFNPGVIRGGEKSNVVAQHCDLDLELRIPWGCSISDLVTTIVSRAPRGTVMVQASDDPSMTDPSSPIVSVTCREVRKVYGGDVFPIVQWAASDARHLRKAGFSVIEYGPGEISTLHAVNERVRIDSLVNATKIYTGIMEAYTEKLN